MLNLALNSLLTTPAAYHPPPPTTPTPSGLRHLLRLSKVLKAKRTAAGALQLASPEVKFQLDKGAAGPAGAANVDEMKQTSDAMDMGMYQVSGLRRGLRCGCGVAVVSLATQLMLQLPQPHFASNPCCHTPDARHQQHG
jgi:hypothetical protein